MCKRNHPDHEQVRDTRGKNRCRACRRLRRDPNRPAWLDEPDPIENMVPVRGAAGIVRWVQYA